MYKVVAILSSVIGHRKGVVESLIVAKIEQKDSTRVLALVEVNRKWQKVYPHCKDVYTDFKAKKEVKTLRQSINVRV